MPWECTLHLPQLYSSSRWTLSCSPWLLHFTCILDQQAKMTVYTHTHIPLLKFWLKFVEYLDHMGSGLLSSLYIARGRVRRGKAGRFTCPGKEGEIDHVRYFELCSQSNDNPPPGDLIITGDPYQALSSGRLGKEAVPPCGCLKHIHPNVNSYEVWSSAAFPFHYCLKWHGCDLQRSSSPSQRSRFFLIPLASDSLFLN